jgi:transcriptional repressor NrdR
MVVKTDNRREPFDRQKIERGVSRALEKRPVSSMQIENLVNDIEDQAEIQGRINHEISSHDLGELVLEKIGEIDKVAYVRFASVYRHFDSPEEFIRVIQNIGNT